MEIDIDISNKHKVESCPILIFSIRLKDEEWKIEGEGWRLKDEGWWMIGDGSGILSK